MTKAYWIAASLCTVSTSAWGQAQVSYSTVCPADDIEFCSITVTGNLATSRSEQSETIEAVNIANARLEKALGDVAGLQQFRRSDARSANASSQGVTLRGLGGNASSRALLFLDDVPQADPFGGWISWPAYDAIDLASVRVRKGAGIVSAGPGAIAGIIELDSAQWQDKINLNANYGSRNSVNAKAVLARNLGDGHVTISGDYQRGDGFIPTLAGQRGTVDRPAPYAQAGLSLRSVIPVSSQTNLQVSVRGFTDERERGFEFSDNQNSGVDASVRLVNRGYEWQWSALAYVQIRDFASRFGAISPDRSSVALTLDQYSVPSTGLGARAELRSPTGGNIELRIGGEWRRTSGRTNENFFFTGGVPGRYRTAGGETDTIGAYADVNVEPAGELVLTAGGRIDHWRISSGFRRETNISGPNAGSVRSDDRFGRRSDWEGTGRVGFAYSGIGLLKLRGSGYTSWRLPTLNELYRPFRVGPDATAANAFLSPERVYGAELSFDYSTGYLEFGATAFINRLNGAIANVTRGQGPGLFPGVGFVSAGGAYRVRENLDAINSKGVEAKADLTLGAIKLHANYAYIDASVVASGAASALNGLRPAQVPQHFANAGLDYAGKRLAFDANMRFVSGQFDDDANSRHLASAFTADAGLSYKVSEKFRFDIRGENLFDARVESAISSSGIIERAGPRTLLAGIRFVGL